MITLETERLILRMFRQDDLDAYAAMCADEEVMRYIGEGKAIDRVAAWRQMAMMLGQWCLKGHGQFALEERATGTLLGRAGYFEPEGWPGFELGWLLRRESWGKGYATEATRLLLRHAFEAMGRGCRDASAVRARRPPAPRPRACSQAPPPGAGRRRAGCLPAPAGRAPRTRRASTRRTRLPARRARRGDRAPGARGRRCPWCRP